MEFFRRFGRIFARHIGNILFFAGGTMFFLGAFALYDEVSFQLEAVAVEATVADTLTECSLRWTEVGMTGRVKKETENMECARAEWLAAQNPQETYRIIEHRQTELSYTAPSGTFVRKWTRIIASENGKLERGDRVTVMVDPANAERVHRKYDRSDLFEILALLTIVGGSVYGGWRIRRATAA